MEALLRSLAASRQLLDDKSAVLCSRLQLVKQGLTFLVVDLPADVDIAETPGARVGLSVIFGVTVTDSDGSTFSWGLVAHQVNSDEWLIERHHSVLTESDHVEVDLPDIRCGSAALSTELPGLLAEVLAQEPGSQSASN